MWNSEDKDDTSREQLENVSSALNLSPDHMQQFMRGDMSLESLVALKPSSSYNETNDTLMENSTSEAATWSDLNNSSLFPSTTAYESSSIADMLSGSTPATPFSASFSTDKADVEYSFRSPPPSSDSATLMELSTVTPSRIRNSPISIISKKQIQSQASENNSLPSSSTLPPPDNPSVYSDLHQMDAFPTPYPEVRERNDESNQFKIVISASSQSSSEPTANYFVDLNSVSFPASESVEDDCAVEQPSSSYPATVSSHSTLSSLQQQALDIESDLIKQHKKVPKKGGNSRLPKDLRGLMGEANLCYARGDYEDAMKMCLELIRSAPYAGEPYETMGMVFEEMGKKESSLQYSLLAARLLKTDSEQWVHLAELCLKQGDEMKAMDCYTEASKMSPTKYPLHIECAKLQLKIGSIARAMTHYRSAINHMPNEEGKAAVQIARDMSKICHDNDLNALGVGLLEQAFKSHPTFFKDEDANLLCELLLLQKEYMSVFDLLSQLSLLEIDYEDETTTPKKMSKIEVSPDMPVDLLCKVATAGIWMNNFDLVDDIVTKICSHDASVVGDIQFDLAETYFAMENYTAALRILDILVETYEYSLAAVWLRHAECHRHLNNVEKSLASYRRCVMLAPGHVQAHLLYAKALRSVEKYRTAIQTLEVAENYEIEPKQHMRLYYERYTNFKLWAEKKPKSRRTVKIPKLPYAADTALLIMMNKFHHVLYKELRIILVKRKKSSSSRLSGELKLIHKPVTLMPGDDDTVDDVGDTFLKGDFDIFSKEEWLEFYDETISVLVKCSRYRDGVLLGEGLLYYPKWYEHLATRRHLEHVTFCLCVLGKDYQKAYSYISTWLRTNPTCTQLWNYFNYLITKTEDQRHQKFCLRMFLKNPDCLPVVVMTGHNWMASGFYTSAVREYMHAHKQEPDEPLYLLLLAVAFINLTSQKFTDYKHSFIAQGLVYFHKYLKLRGFPQECYYNIGRAMHQLGLEHYAIHYYEKALDCRPPPVPNADRARFDSRSFDLRKEIGFNLSLIYRRSGNHLAANDALSKYCVV